MKPRAASCAVGSELGLLFTFHESFEPFNPPCKALASRFYYSSDNLALQLSLPAGRATAVSHSLSTEEDHIVLLAGWSF